jgi:hypothetical protein
MPQHQVALVLCLVVVHAVAAEQLSVSDLLDRYAANQGQLKSFVVRTKATLTQEVTQDEVPSHSSVEQQIVEFRYEKDGGDFRAYYRPKDAHSAEDGSPVSADQYYTYLWDRERYIEHYRGPTLDDSHAYVSSSRKDIKDAITRGYFGAGSILGFLYGDVEQFDSILRQADSICVRDQPEQVGSAACYVIDAKTKSGTYTVWLDPEHGYGIAKAVVHKGPEDLRFGRPPDSYKSAPYEHEIFSIRNVRFKNIEGVWVPMEADFRIDSKGPNRASMTDIHHRVTELVLNPDHDALGSFVPDVENGTKVYIEEAPGIVYTWQDGKLIPNIDKYAIEQIDRITDNLTAEGKVPAGASTVKKTEAAPNEPSAITDTKADTAEAQREVLSETRVSPVLVLIPIGLLIIAVIAWRVFLLKRK